jgi:ABC-type transport system involved in multi-copper enzyme maturation permease subunit
VGNDRRWYLVGGLLYAVVLEALLAGAILYWPDLGKSLGSLRVLAPMEMLRDMIDVMEQTGIVAYVHLQHFFKGCHSLGGLVAVLFAAFAISGEAWRGTLEILLARPLSRRRILLERWTFGALALVLPVFATTATVPALLAHVGESMGLGGLMLAATHESLFLLAIYSATFLASCLSDKPLAIVFVALVLSLFEFSIYLVKVLTHWSVFRLADVWVFDRITKTGSLQASLWVPMLVFSAACLFASLRAFERRVP